MAADSTYPFAALSIWRERIQSDLESPQYSETFKVRTLLEQGHLCEQAVFGCLKDSLFDIYECQAWGLCERNIAQQQRNELYDMAHRELLNDKLLIVELARKHDVLKQYTEQIQRSINANVSAYEKIGELQMGLIAWKSNMSRDAALFHGEETAEVIENLLQQRYLAAVALIHRCVETSNRPASLRKERVMDQAMKMVRLCVEESISEHHLDRDAVWMKIDRSDCRDVGLDYELSISLGGDRYVIE